MTNFAGPYPLTVPVGSSMLQALKPFPQVWPKIAMLDTAMNQDCCKGATLQSGYSGAGEVN